MLPALQQVYFDQRTVFQVLLQVLLHATESTHALLKSGDVLFLKLIKVVPVGLETCLDDLLNGLIKGVLVVTGHFVHQTKHLVDLTVMGLSHVVRLFSAFRNLILYFLFKFFS